MGATRQTPFRFERGLTVSELQQRGEKSFCRFVASVDSFLGVICLHVPAVAGSLLEASLTMSAVSSPFFRFS